MRKLWLTLALSLLIMGSLSRGSAYASGFETFAISARGLAMANALVARGDDPLSFAYNPAGLTNNGVRTLTLGAHVTLNDVRYLQKEIEGEVALPNTIAANNPKNFAYTFSYTDNFGVDGFGLGLAAYSPYNSNIGWGNFSDYRYVVLSSRWQSYFVTLAASYSPNKYFGFGVGGSYTATTFNFKSFVDLTEHIDYVNDPVEGIKQGLVVAESRFTMDLSDDSSFTYSAGFWVRPIDQLTIGGSYQAKTDIDLKGGWQMYQPFNADYPAITAWDNGKVSEDFYFHNQGSLTTTLPSIARLGFFINASKKVTFSTDITYTMWKDMENSVYKNDRLDNQIFTFTAPHFYQWKNAIRAALGMEYIYEATKYVVRFRGGYTFDQSAIPESAFQGSFFDCDKHILSLGAGIDFSKNYRLDFSFAHAFTNDVTVNVSNFPDRRSGAAGNESAAGTYSNVWDMVSVSFTYFIGGRPVYSVEPAPEAPASTTTESPEPKASEEPSSTPDETPAEEKEESPSGDSEPGDASGDESSDDNGGGSGDGDGAAEDGSGSPDDGSGEADGDV